MKVDICKMVIEKNLEEGLKELEDLKESVKVALKEVQSIIFDLRPMSLDDLGLRQTIDQTANAIFKESNIDIKIKMKPIQMEIEPIIQVAVYRIVQEIFNNIRKHSKAKHANVRMDFGTKYLMLIINDDGVGFNVEETLKRVNTKGASYGLIGILDRVKQLQGEIEIKSSEKVGTTYTVKLPINQEVIKNEEQGDRILIADDHDIIRQGLKRIISFEEDMDIVCEAENGEKALKFLKYYELDVVVLDCNMPIMDGIQVLKSIKDKDNKIKAKKASNILDNLSKREIEVLNKISKGFSNKEIGEQLYISEKTVKNYATNLFKKINVDDRVHAAIVAIENNIDEYYRSKYET